MQPPPPPIVTLTSDFGWRDYYLALLKGAMLSRHPQLRLIDISHDINNYDIVQAAFIFSNAWRAFPEGTIHIVSVNDFSVAEARFLAFQAEGHYFIGPDNGLFSLVFDKMPAELYHLPAPPTDGFPLRVIYAGAVAHLADGKPLAQIGEPATGWEERLSFQPVIGPSYIRGSVVYIDKFENVMLNIPRTLFEKVGRGRPFELYFKRHEPITNLCDNFHDAPLGETLCRFNSADLLEIAVNMGRAGTLLGLKLEDTVQVDFHDGELKAPKSADSSGKQKP